MKRSIVPAALLATIVALPVSAEQFAVQIDREYQEASPKLMDVLKVSAVESFTENDSHYVVIEAPSEAYVEAFFHATNLKAIELHALEANWENPTMQHLSIAQRLGFLREIDCGFCTS